MNRPKPNRIRKKAHIIYLSDEEEAAVKLRMERLEYNLFQSTAER